DITVTGINDAPTISSSGATVVSDTEDTPATISGLSVADIDGGSNVEQITLSAAHGTVTFGGHSGASVTVTDTLANINAALANGVGYAPAANYSGVDALHVSVNDLVPGAALTTTSDIAIGIAPVADTPTVATLTTSYDVPANSTITLTGFTGLSDTDGSETL